MENDWINCDSNNGEVFHPTDGIDVLAIDKLGIEKILYIISFPFGNVTKWVITEGDMELGDFIPVKWKFIEK